MKIFVAELKSLKTAVAILFFILGMGSARAQEIKASAKLDSNDVTIGDQVRLVLEVNTPQGKTFQLPLIPDTMGKVEVITRITDTIRTGASIQSLRQVAVITSFDSGSFTIPSFQFAYRNSTDTTLYVVSTDSLVFRVKGIAVDTTKEIKDIKAPLEVPFSWREFLTENAYYIGAAVAILVLGGLLYYMWKKRKQPGQVIKTVPSRSADIIALEKLEQLDKSKLWQQGNFKEYHSQISDILRIYIEQRFGVNAMELTTDVTIASLKQIPSNEKAVLKQVLDLSDLVKFAKVQPIHTENEASMRLAIEFIENSRRAAQAEGKEVEGV